MTEIEKENDIVEVVSETIEVVDNSNCCVNSSCCNYVQRDEGSTYAALGFMAAFIPFMVIPGLVVSILGISKSRKSGYKGTFSIVSAVLNLTIMVVLITVGSLTMLTVIEFINNLNITLDTINNTAKTVEQNSEVLNNSMSGVQDWFNNLF